MEEHEFPSLGFSKDLAKGLNPRKSLLSLKGRDKCQHAISLSGLDLHIAEGLGAAGEHKSLVDFFIENIAIVIHF